MRRILAGIAAASVAVAISGCSSGDDDSAEDSPTQPASAEASADGSGEDTSGTGSGGTAQDVDLADHEFSTSAQDAIDTATKEAGEGTVHSIGIEWEDRHSAWAWTVKTLVGDQDHTYEISADTGEVLSSEQEQTNDKEEAIDLNQPMSFDEAKEKALAERQGRIKEWSYEWDDNRKQFQFDIEHNGDAEEVTVDADSGEVAAD